MLINTFLFFIHLSHSGDLLLGILHPLISSSHELLGQSLAKFACSTYRRRHENKNFMTPPPKET